MGFPDWQSIVEWVGPPIFPPQDVVLSGVGAFNFIEGQAQTSYESALVAVYAPTNPVWLEADVLAAHVTDLPAETVRVYLPAGGQLIAVVPVAGTWIEAALLHGTPGDTIRVAAWPTNLEPGVYPPPGGHSLFTGWPLAVGGAATVTEDLQPFYGDAQLTVQVPAGANPTTVLLENLHDVSATPDYPYAAQVAAGATLSTPIYLPPGRNQLLVTNGGAAAENVNVSVVARHSLGRAQ